jgi:hypothetical protein
VQPNYISLSKIFGPDARLTVPLFQRPYVWSREEQWAPLWDDVAALAERVLNADPKKPPAGHFLGTAVLEQVPNAMGSLQVREVIDGQQRLTTLQVLLKAAEHAVAELQARENEEPAKGQVSFAGRRLKSLTGNAAYGSEEEKYKVWPTNDDRDAFRAVMDAQSAVDLTSVSTRLSEAYRYFATQIRAWLDNGEAAARASALASALSDHLRLIILDLDETDEPQAIFETLNAHGTPLLPADLIKNKLLWEATRQELDLKALYNTYWRPFDADPAFWRAHVGTGHAARPRIDLLLQHWLTRRTLEPVPVKHLYERFLKYLVNSAPEGEPKDVAVEAVLADILEDANNYRRITTPTGHSRFAEFVRRLARLDMVVFQPLLLAAMRRPNAGPADLDSLALVLESYLVRRTICAGQTRGYGTFALKLIEAVEGSDLDRPVGQVVADALAAEDGHLAWPDDQAFWNHWSTRPFYGYLKRDRVLMVLQALEHQHQLGSKLSEPIVSFNFSELQIEHILPQSWEAEWSPPAPPLTYADRTAKLNSIGNLTLVTGRLNASLSNAAWSYPPKPDGTIRRGKREALAEHSQLVLNNRLVSKFADGWDEAGMAQRTDELFKTACQVWPSPSQFVLNDEKPSQVA